MSSEGRPLGFARRCQVQLFFSCLMVQSVSRTRRQLGVPAHRHHRVLAPRCSGRRRSSPHPPLTATVPYHPGLLSAVSAGTASSASWSSRTSCSGLHCTSSRASVPSLVSIGLVDAMWFAVVHSPACPAFARHESTTALVPDPPRPRGALDAAPVAGRTAGPVIVPRSVSQACAQKRSAARSLSSLALSLASLVCRVASSPTTTSGPNCHRVPVRTVRFPASPNVIPA